MTKYQADQLKKLLGSYESSPIFERIYKIFETPDPHPLKVVLDDMSFRFSEDPKAQQLLDLVIHPELTTEQIREVGVASNTAINRYGSFNSIQNQDYMITTIHESIMKLCKVRSD